MMTFMGFVPPDPKRGVLCSAHNSGSYPSYSRPVLHAEGKKCCNTLPPLAVLRFRRPETRGDTMARRNKKTNDRQLDLFAAPPVTSLIGQPEPPPPQKPLIATAELGDADLLHALARANLQNVADVADEVFRRRPDGWEAAALELWNRFRGFGVKKAMREQQVVLELALQTKSRRLLQLVLANGPIGEFLDAELLLAAAACYVPVRQEVVDRGLLDAAEEVRYAAIKVAILSGIPSENIQPYLSDRSAMVRRGTAVALAAAGDVEAREPLLAQMRQQPDLEGLEALGFIANEDVVIRLGQIARLHPDWVPTVIGILEDIGDSTARKVAAGLIG